MNHFKGKFITFEGPEGSGKTTQAKLLYDYLRKRGYRCVLTREPGGSKVGERIRDILLNPKTKDMSSISETLLFEASRSALMDEVIVPALKKGFIVISDRFSDATFAYQGYAGGQNLNQIKAIDDYATRGIKPDITILLDINPKEGLKRACKKKKFRGKDRMESKSLAYHRAVRKGYLAIAKKERSRVRIIRTQSTVDKTRELIKKEVFKCHWIT